MKWMFLALTGVMTALALQVAHAEDDVFLDESDADFKVESPKAPTTAEAAPPTTAATAPAEAASVAPAQTETKEAMVVEPTADAATEAAPAPSKPAKTKNASGKAQKSAKTASTGTFMTTKTECVMHREPASESETLIKVKPDRKLWVEKVSETWVKGFRKEGLGEGYFPRDCF